MNLNEYKETYQWYSGKTSDVVRQLSFAGIAIIWIFKIHSGELPKIPSALLMPLAFFCISLGFDLLQYMIGYIIWYGFFKFQEKKDLPADQEINHPAYLPIPLHGCMIIKVSSVVIAYYLLLDFILNTWLQST